MSDPAVGVSMVSRLMLLVVGGIAGAAMMYGMRPSVAMQPAPVTAEALAAKPPAKATVTGTPLAADDSGAAPVAVVDQRVITLREVENTLLKQEGVQQLMDMLDEQFKRTNWEALSDRDVLIQTNSWRVTRLGVAAQLLKQKAGDAREDLIGIALVQNALKKEGVVIDDAVIANEVKRMEKRHVESLEARKQPYIEFSAFIEQTQKMPLEQYVRQEGFRMGAGIRVLVERRAANELSAEQLKTWFDQHIDRYRVQSAADISDIYIPYQVSKGADGKEHIKQEEKDRLMDVMAQLHQSIFKRQVSFEKNFQTFGRVYDQHATVDGRLGWVNRDGTRPQKGTRRVAMAAMDEAFAAQPPYPVLLSPVISDAGIDMILVHSRRAGKEPVFAELKAQLVSDIVDAELAPRTKRALDDLRRAAVIDYRSLPPLIERRATAAGLSAMVPAAAPTDVPAP